jgi:FtsZ-binding cell division protein ZapB
MTLEEEIQALKEINRDLTRHITSKCDEINSLILANDNLQTKYEAAQKRIQELEMKLYAYDKKTDGFLN